MSPSRRIFFKYAFILGQSSLTLRVAMNKSWHRLVWDTLAVRALTKCAHLKFMVSGQSKQASKQANIHRVCGARSGLPQKLTEAAANELWIVKVSADEIFWCFQSSANTAMKMPRQKYKSAKITLMLISCNKNDRDLRWNTSCMWDQTSTLLIENCHKIYLQYYNLC